jgi:hypothetical protein
MREILDELEHCDAEHAAAWLSDEDGWTLSPTPKGRVVFSDPERRDRHLLNVTKERILSLWGLLALGAFEELERQPWLDGDGYVPPSAEERAKHANELAEFALRQDRVFFDALGDERPNTRCRAPDCERGAIPFSVLCKRHHFESIQKQPCPF